MKRAKNAKGTAPSWSVSTPWKRGVCLASILLLADVLTKALAFHTIPFMFSEVYPFGGVGIFEHFFGVSFSLNLVLNSGLAWGLFAGHAGLLCAVRILISCGLIGYLIQKNLGSAPFWMVVAGALGNSLDCVLYGQVVDFLHVRFSSWSFPCFNFADSYVSLAACWLFLKPNQLAAVSVK